MTSSWALSTTFGAREYNLDWAALTVARRHNVGWSASLAVLSSATPQVKSGWSSTVLNQRFVVELECRSQRHERGYLPLADLERFDEAVYECRSDSIGRPTRLAASTT